MRKYLLFLCLFCSGVVLAQDRVVTGTVTSSEDGSLLPGVSILVKGSTKGTTTNGEGAFSITTSANATLAVSFIGFVTKEVEIGGKSVLNITLDSDIQNLSEVVVTAFGIKRDKKTLGYGVTQLNTEELTQARTTNVTNALAGKVPGVRVSGSGGAFTGSSIVIRGNTTFTGSNQPLFVIDGVPIDNGGGGTALQTGVPPSNRAIDINQDDIETMTVLKGPSAAALYGSRASNGVILITTKKGGLNQKNSVTFSTSYAVEEVNRIPDYQNEYGQGTGGRYINTSPSSWGPKIAGQTVTNFFREEEQLQAYPNNVKDIFQKGKNFQGNLGFSGGNDKSSFRFSYGYLSNTSVIDINKLERHNFSLNTAYQVNKKLNVSVSANYVNNHSKRTQQGNQLSSPLFRAWFMPRSYDLSGLPFEDAAGNQLYFGGEDNPYWTIKHNRYNDEINRVIGNVALKYNITDWLNADYKLGTDVYSTFIHGYDQIGARGAANTTAGGAGGVLERRNQYRNFNSNLFFTATKNFGDFTSALIVGNEVSQIYNRTSSVTGLGVIVRDFEQMKNTTTYNPTFGSSKVRLIGLYGDLTVGYKSIASVNVTLRNDWSSTFLKDNRSYLYNAVAASLNITELFPTMKNDVIDNIKIRGNVATVGKAGTDFVYNTDSYFVGASSSDGFGPVVSFPYNGLQGFTLSNTAGNSGLGPEFTTNKEIAAEVSLFKSRLTFEGTLYQQKSRDLIFSVPVSGASGITSVTKNAGSMSNKGVELGVTVVPVKTKSVNWGLTFNYTQFKSKVEELADNVSNIFLGGFTTPNIRLVAGDEYGQIYGNAYLRQRQLEDGSQDRSSPMIIGANGLPMITSGVEKIGNPNPKFLLGINNSLSVKGFNLSFLIDIKKGGDQYSRNIADIRRNGVAAETAEFERFNADGTATTPYMFEGVNAAGEANTIPVTVEQYWGNLGKYAAAEGYILETSWVRLREASLSYKIPTKLLTRTPFGSVEASVFGRNLWMRTPNYPHFDPEQNALGVSNAQGLEFNALPQTRSMGVSLRASF
ncbi:MAG TPA: SusC/RagA family TonB-linked outer membrane protein [Dyadobacter sp.]|jgi:TonB-linked SusC/RagA family outer membrane protein|nr:SusC/RagA family TonB-linked outer membrane protein [Dyadobacter sp.]